MERLTFEGNFCDIAMCRENPCPYNGSCTQREVWERLKAYEDAGLSPTACVEARKIEEGLNADDYSIARMVELMKADKEGRVVVLPSRALSTETEDGRQTALERAIEHLGYLLRDHAFECEDCKQDHRELLAFLVELRERRGENG